jgi:tripartite-type tricarboxylate transporter receptor subunit TctC
MVRGFTACVVLAILLTATAGAAAQTPEAFYKGRQITFLIGAGAGGGYDVYFRTFARHVVHHIPQQHSDGPVVRQSRRPL